MTVWHLRALHVDEKGIARFRPLSSEQQKRVKLYKDALRVSANSSVPNPQFSNYFVREAIGSLKDAEPKQAGNIEYGLCQALHGEESAVAAFRTAHGRDGSFEQGIVLGIATEHPEGVPNPCGNCRDIMLEDLGIDFEIVSGSSRGGPATVVNMKDLLFDAFTPINLEHASQQVNTRRGFLVDMLPHNMSVHEFCDCVSHTAREGRRLSNDAYSPSGRAHARKYSVGIFTEHDVYFGAHDVMAEYHPIYAGEDAVRMARRARDPFIRFVIVTVPYFREKTPPHVMYRDRQHILELNVQAEIMRGNANDPPVFLVTHKDGAVVDVWRTTVKEWIPFPFSPQNFGPEFLEHLKRYYAEQGR